jgi:hypothetical protein
VSVPLALQVIGGIVFIAGVVLAIMRARGTRPESEHS